MKNKNSAEWLIYSGVGIQMAASVVLCLFLGKWIGNYFNLEQILTYGAISYPVAILINDLTNRRYWKNYAKKIVYIGFIFGIFLTFFF